MLVFGATPIGNLEDISLRLLRLLQESAVIVTEDTRVTRRLMDKLKIFNDSRLISFHDHNERSLRKIIALAQESDVLVLVDAGTPGISDPGFSLVQEAVAAGIGFTVLPGPCAAITALLMSGLPCERFCFEGFLPRKSVKRVDKLRELGEEVRTMVFYEAPHRLLETLEDMVLVFGEDRRAAFCREISKLHEEVIRGSLQDLCQRAQAEVRGEICLVVAGYRKNTAQVFASALAKVNRLVDQGVGLKIATEIVAEYQEVSKRALYEESLVRRSKL